MGAWGPGLWSDDTSSDVRATYREALEDGLSDEDAAASVLASFEADLGDEDQAGVVWIALAVAQSSLGRLSPDVRDHAIEVIDSGSDLQRWAAADAKVAAKRRAVLAKAREQLVGEQPTRKRIRKPPRPATTLAPGDVIGFLADSGRRHVLIVRALESSRYGLWPVVELLDYARAEIPTERSLRRLKPRTKGRSAQGDKPAEPWWTVRGVVTHRRGHDFGDHGFELIGRVSAASTAVQEAWSTRPGNYASWAFWSEYLQRQDALLGERLASRSSRRFLQR